MTVHIGHQSARCGSQSAHIESKLVSRVEINAEPALGTKYFVRYRIYYSECRTARRSGRRFTKRSTPRSKNGPFPPSAFLLYGWALAFGCATSGGSPKNPRRR